MFYILTTADTVVKVQGLPLNCEVISTVNLGVSCSIICKMQRPIIKIAGLKLTANSKHIWK